MQITDIQMNIKEILQTTIVKPIQVVYILMITHLYIVTYLKNIYI